MQILYCIGSFLVGCGVGVLGFQYLRKRQIMQTATDIDGWCNRIKQRLIKYPGVNKEISTDVDAMLKAVQKIKQLAVRIR